MRCAKARHYVGLELDAMLTPTAAEELKQHFAICAACKSYRESFHVALTAVQDDAAALKAAPLSSGFQAKLHAALVAEQASRKSRTTGRVITGVRLGLYPRILRTAAGLAALLIFAALITFALLQTPKPPVQECRFGHLGSLTIRQDNTGRVYASTANRNWAGRCDLPGGRPQ